MLRSRTKVVALKNTEVRSAAAAAARAHRSHSTLGGETQKSHHHPTAKANGSDGADSVQPASRLRRVRSTKKSRRSRALAKFGRCRREGAPLSLGDKSCEAGEGGLPH